MKPPSCAGGTGSCTKICVGSRAEGDTTRACKVTQPRLSSKGTLHERIASNLLRQWTQRSAKIVALGLKEKEISSEIQRVVERRWTGPTS